MKNKFKMNKQIEDIYPLTIIRTRFGKFVILNCESDADCVTILESDELVQYNIHDYMNREFPFLFYGVGDNLNNAFYNFLEQQLRIVRIEK